MDKRGPRRAYKKGNAFKENKVVIGNESRKPKRKDPHIFVESSEFQLLVKLYVPAQLLITNNKVSLKQLKVHLPVLIKESYPDLNLELHLLLSSIVTSYVLSWYLQKLNTDNTDFIVHVYTALCDFVRDFSQRLLAMVELQRLFGLINDMAAILNKHILDNQLIDGVPRYARDFILKDSSKVLMDYDAISLMRRYLAESHVVFQGAFPSPETRPEDVDPGQVYYRAIALGILDATFSGKTGTAQGCRDSDIVTIFLTTILADLGFSKLVGLLSSPKFLIHDTLTTLAAKLCQNADVPPERETPQSMFQILRNKASTGWNIMYLMLLSDLRKAEKLPLVFYSPVFDLIDTVIRFSQVRPVLTHCLSLIRASLYVNKTLAFRLDSFIVKSVTTMIRTSPILQDGFLAGTVSKLRTIVIDRTAKLEEPPTREQTPKELSEKIYSAFVSKSSQNRFFGALIRSLAYNGQQPKEAMEEIEGFIQIFCAPIGEGNKSDMNKVLVVKLLDSIIREMYPCLVEDVKMT